MLNFLNRLWGRRKSIPSDDAPLALASTGVVKVDFDRVAPEERPALIDLLFRHNRVPRFKGTVEHGYSKAFVKSLARCPRCGAPTRQCGAEFIYATDRAVRSQVAPAGFFCSACPTVIIDDTMIAQGVKEGFVFQGLLGIHHGGSAPDSMFKTWNDQETVYIMDEEAETVHLSTMEGSTGPRRPIRAKPKVGRNDRCPCSSGKKYKVCCGR
jgi:SEC-C motif